jgi:hypothetical protein
VLLSALEQSVETPVVSSTITNSGGPTLLCDSVNVDIDAAVAAVTLRVELGNVLTTNGLLARQQAAPWYAEWDSAQASFSKAVAACCGSLACPSLFLSGARVMQAELCGRFGLVPHAVACLRAYGQAIARLPGADPFDFPTKPFARLTQEEVAAASSTRLSWLRLVPFVIDVVEMGDTAQPVWCCNCRTSLAQVKKADELGSLWLSQTSVGDVPASWSTPASRAAVSIKQQYARVSTDPRGYVEPITCAFVDVGYVVWSCLYGPWNVLPRKKRMPLCCDNCRVILLPCFFTKRRRLVMMPQQ